MVNRTNHPSKRTDSWVDPRGTDYALTNGDYLSTWDIAKDLEGAFNRIVYPESIFRWAKRWFGPLPEGRTGGRQGYRIPPEYRYVARAWMQVHDWPFRDIATRALVESPRDWLVVVDKTGSTHYSVNEVIQRVEGLVRSDAFRGYAISVLYVGLDDHYQGKGHR